MITIDRCPSTLAQGYETYSPKALNLLFDGRAVSHIMPFPSPSSENAKNIVSIKNAGRLSLSGAQSKFGLTIDSDDRLQYSLPHTQSTYILKPKPIGYHLMNHEYCAANENLTMQLAAQIYGIETAANGLCFYENGEPAYITRRFDISQNQKFAQEDFASLMGVSRNNGGSDFKYNHGSYEECGEIIGWYVKAARVDMLRFFRVLLFNFITLNDDAHLKNFSLLKRSGEYRLSPAYDLINTSLHLYEPRIFALERGLFKEGMQLCDTRTINYKDFLELGHRLGIPEKLVMKELIRFSRHNPEADSLINVSFLSDELKNVYRHGMHYRQLMLRPE